MNNLVSNVKKNWENPNVHYVDWKWMDVFKIWFLKTEKFVMCGYILLWYNDGDGEWTLFVCWFCIGG